MGSGCGADLTCVLTGIESHTLVVSVTVFPTPFVAPDTVSVSPVTVPPRVLPNPPTGIGVSCAAGRKSRMNAGGIGWQFPVWDTHQASRRLEDYCVLKM